MGQDGKEVGMRQEDMGYESEADGTSTRWNIEDAGYEEQKWHGMSSLRSGTSISQDIKGACQQGSGTSTR